MPEPDNVSIPAAAAPDAVSIAPVGSAERISSIDVLRGFALLGIALMNILFSGLPLAAGFNPNVAGGATRLNLAAFFLQYILFDGKMRGIFSLMFGAGAFYLIQRGIDRGVAFETVKVYYRRTLWLMLFGMIHAFLIWHGDILYPYALLGLVLFPMLFAKPRGLLIAAGVCVLVMTGMQVAQGFRMQKMHKLVLEAEQAVKEKKTPTEEQKAAQKQWEEQRKYFSPSADDLKKDREMYAGSYVNLLKKRVPLVREWHSSPFYAAGWDMFAMMLIGIAMAQTGVLAAGRSMRFYVWMLAIGYGFGLPVGAASAWIGYRQNFEPLQTVFTFSTYQTARVAMTLGHVALLLIICKAGLFAGLRARLAAVGQTAFSNYILHSVIYGFVFYGYGLGLYGKLERYQLYYVVFGMWVFSMVVSPAWLRAFRFGPLEWCWRSLTYWKRQPMRVKEAKLAEVFVEEPMRMGTAVDGLGDEVQGT